jgi:hypothetical protein
MDVGVTDPRQAEQIVERLENALGDSAFPSTYRRWGAQLLSNLRRPVDVAVIGAPGSGKTSLINMMLGRHDIPALPGFDLVEVAYGPSLSIKLEFEDGTMRRVDGPAVDPSLCEGAIRASVELSDPALLQQSFTELCLPEAPGHRESILRLACQNSAILVFCSENFGEPEQALWAKVPDEIKDRSFLVLTKADRLLMKGRLAQRISELEDTVTEGFFGLYPVATLQGIAARVKGRTTQMDLWETSGGREFCTSLERLIRLGRAEDLDNAQMLLGRVAGPTSRADGESMGRTAPQNPKAGPAERQASATGSSATEAGKTLAGSDSHVLKNQLDQLQRCADEMLELFGETGGTDPARIIEQCVEAMESLSDSMMAAGVDTPEIRKVRDDAQEGQDILLLLRLEGDENAAADAVALMTQLKKEIFERLND